MNKKKKKMGITRGEKMLYKFSTFMVIFLVIGIILSRSSLSQINVELQKLENQVANKSDENQSLVMKINEMVSLEKIKHISNEQGLTYNNENIKTVFD